MLLSASQCRLLGQYAKDAEQLRLAYLPVTVGVYDFAEAFDVVAGDGPASDYLEGVSEQQVDFVPFQSPAVVGVVTPKQIVDGAFELRLIWVFAEVHR